jgi:alginate O-acetyltransferase complex protein AlgJ
MRDSCKAGALIFFLALLAPATVQFFSERAAISTAEKRALEPLPAWPARLRDWRTFPSDLDRFMRDHFGLREPLAAGWGLARYALRYTPRVAVGSEGWLYFPQYWRSKYGVAGCGPLAGEVRSLAGRLDRLAASAARIGVTVLLAIAPDKETIYPEYLPEGLGAVGCDLYAEFMGALQRAKRADLRAALAGSKAKEQIYFKTDSHWNDVGGLRAARLLLEGSCVPGEVCARLPEPRLTTKTLGGDLAGLIGLASVLTERYLAVEVSGEKHVGRRLIVVGDSFAKSIVRFLAADESVAEAAFVDHAEGRVRLAPILASKPDAILIVIAERYLYDRELLRSLAAGY